MEMWPCLRKPRNDRDTHELQWPAIITPRAYRIKENNQYYYQRPVRAEDHGRGTDQEKLAAHWLGPIENTLQCQSWKEPKYSNRWKPTPTLPNSPRGQQISMASFYGNKLIAKHSCRKYVWR
jgi:hypothetical protein